MSFLVFVAVTKLSVISDAAVTMLLNILVLYADGAIVNKNCVLCDFKNLSFLNYSGGERSANALENSAVQYIGMFVTLF